MGNTPLTSVSRADQLTRFVECVTGGGRFASQWRPLTSREPLPLTPAMVPAILQRMEGEQLDVVYQPVVDTGEGRYAFVLFVDVDGKTPPDVPCSFRVKSRNGCHLYWVLREPIPDSRFPRWMKAAAALLDGDLAIASPNRWMRLPMTFNSKSSPPVQTVFEHSGAASYADAAEALAVIILAVTPYEEGGRHDAVLSIAARLHEAGFTEDEAIRVVTALCRVAGDNEVRDRLAAVSSTYAKADAGLPVKRAGAPRLTKKEKPEPVGVVTPDGAEFRHQSIIAATAQAIHSLGRLGSVDGNIAAYNGRYWEVIDDRRLAGVVVSLAVSMRVLMSDGSTQPLDVNLSYGSRLRMLTDLVSAMAAGDPIAETPGIIPTNTCVYVDDRVEPHSPVFGNGAVFNADRPGEWRGTAFEGFLSEALPDESARTYIQVCVGAAAGGEAHWLQKMLWFIGPPGTGKSTLTRVLHGVFGGYAVVVDIGAMGEYDIARLAGKRLLVANEAEGRVAGSAIKMVTSGDAMRGRHIYARPFDVTFRGLVVATSNEYPKTYDIAGLLRRFVFIPFTVKPATPKAFLVAELLNDTAPVLGWVMEGWEMFKAWRSGKIEIAVPEVSSAASKRFALMNDTAAHFASRCLSHVEGVHARLEDVYSAYRGFCEVLNLTPRRFGIDWLDALEACGFSVSSDGTLLENTKVKEF